MFPMGITRRKVEIWAWASLVANTVIILTGGLVRLTGSGLGCPTWPRCTDESFVPHAELGWHGVIEFGNRLLTYVLIGIAIATVVAVWRWTESTRFARRLCVVMALGIPFQAVVGGITVLTDLNPWIVAIHLLLSLALVTASTVLVAHVRPVQAVSVSTFHLRLIQGCYILVLLAIYLGTVVTGSGPHAGDANSPRNGLDPQTWSRIHAWSVWVLVAVTIVVVWQVRRTELARPTQWLLVTELAQGLVGYVQFFTGLPILLVAAHLVGAAVLLAVATYVVLLASGGHQPQMPQTSSQGSLQN